MGSQGSSCQDTHKGSPFPAPALTHIPEELGQNTPQPSHPAGTALPHPWQHDRDPLPAFLLHARSPPPPVFPRAPSMGLTSRRARGRDRMTAKTTPKFMPASGPAGCGHMDGEPWEGSSGSRPQAASRLPVPIASAPGGAGSRAEGLCYLIGWVGRSSSEHRASSYAFQ